MCEECVVHSHGVPQKPVRQSFSHVISHKGYLSSLQPLLEFSQFAYDLTVLGFVLMAGRETGLLHKIVFNFEIVARAIRELGEQAYECASRGIIQGIDEGYELAAKIVYFIDPQHKSFVGPAYEFHGNRVSVVVC